MYSIRVKASHRWSSAQVSGRIFSKHEAAILNELAINDEIRNSPLLDVEEIVNSTLFLDAQEMDATDSAIELAAETGVSLTDITGTGEGGRILKRDVRAYLSEVTDDTQG